MNFVQSFWSKPINSRIEENLLDRGNGGWKTRKLFYMSWALSCLQIKKYYPEIKLKLVTDNEGKEVLIDSMKLPYDSVSLELSEISNYDKNLWAIGKVIAYNLQTEPFIHIDGDVFIWGRALDSILTSELCAQNVDNKTWYYSMVSKKVLKYFDIPPHLKSYLKKGEVYGVNAGILGGRNLEFLKKYAQAALKLIDDNINNLNYVEKNYFNMFYEQFLFSIFQRSQGIRLSTLFNKLSETYEEIIDMSMIPIQEYNHIVGYAKKNMIINEQVLIRLKLCHPSHFELINKQFQDG